MKDDAPSQRAHWQRIAQAYDGERNSVAIQTTLSLSRTEHQHGFALARVSHEHDEVHQLRDAIGLLLSIDSTWPTSSLPDVSHLARDSALYWDAEQLLQHTPAC